jgi:hypothetical protein
MLKKVIYNPMKEITRWSKYDRDYLCVNKSQLVQVIFEPPCIISKIITKFPKKTSFSMELLKEHKICKFFPVSLTLSLHWTTQSRYCNVCLSVERAKFPLFLGVGWSNWFLVRQYIFHIFCSAEPVSERNHEISHYSAEYQLRHSVRNSDESQGHFIIRLITNAMKNAYKLYNYERNLNRWKPI